MVFANVTQKNVTQLMRHGKAAPGAPLSLLNADVRNAGYDAAETVANVGARLVIFHHLDFQAAA
jgi:hypothetical protein